MYIFYREKAMHLIHSVLRGGLFTLTLSLAGYVQAADWWWGEKGRPDEQISAGGLHDASAGAPASAQAGATSGLLLAQAAGATYESTYRLGRGDSISVSVFGEKDLTVEEVRLSDAGTFSYPFLGEIRAAGRTVGEVEKDIEAGLMGGYLLDPKVSVRIVAYREFYINGEVKEPGGYPYQPGLTVRKAVALAGGFTERASKNKIYMIPEGRADQNEPKRVDVDSQIGPGATITIEQRFF